MTESRERIADAYQQVRLAARILAEAQRLEIEAEAAFDLAWAKAMLDENNRGKNKEQREAYCDVASWTERAQHDKARINLRQAEAGYKAARAAVAEIETMATILNAGMSPADLWG